MKVNLPHTAKMHLKQTPVDTPRLIMLTQPLATALALRVHDPLPFRRKELAIQLRLVGTQGKEGVWVIALVFRLLGPPSTRREGILCLNPREESDSHLVRLLTLQEHFFLLFCSPHLHAVVRRETPWSVQQRQEARLLMGHSSPSPGRTTPRGTPDHEFAAATEEFLRLYTVSTLLAGSPAAGARTTTPFRGVVLD